MASINQYIVYLFIIGVSKSSHDNYMIRGGGGSVIYFCLIDVSSKKKKHDKLKLCDCLLFHIKRTILRLLTKKYSKITENVIEKKNNPTYINFLIQVDSR